METISIVRGNDFRLRIPLRRHVIQPDGSVVPDDFDPATVDVMKVFLEGADCVRELPWVEDDEHDSSIVCDVDGLTPLGSYHLIVAGKRDGVKFRSKERRQFRIVDNNERANIWPTQYDGFEAYVLDTMIILDARGRDGLSAYEIAVVNGFTGTETQWLKSLAIKSIVKTGTNDLTDTYTITYSNGTTSTFDLQNGEGTYHLAVRLGLFSGTEEEWATTGEWELTNAAVHDALNAMCAALENATAEVGEAGPGTPGVTASYEDGHIHFVFDHIKGDTGKEGPDGPQGTSAIWGGEDEVLTQLEHTLGNYTNRTMSQKGITEQMKKAVDITGDEFILQRSSLTAHDCSVGSDGEWYKASGGSQKHYAIPVTPGQKFRIEVTDQSAGVRYAFVTSSYTGSYSDNDTIPVASGQNKAVGVGGSSVITAPADAAYLCVNKIAGAGTELSYNLYYVGNQNVGGVEYRNPVAVDLSDALEDPRPCSHGTDTWYRQGTSGSQRHIVIAVEPGKTYKFRVKDGGTFAAVLTNTYNPATTYTNGSAMPLASCNTERIVVHGWRYITIPDDGAYLTMTTVDGSGNTWEWEVYEVTPVEVGIKDAPKDVPVKLRVMQWNVGNWGLGAAAPTLTPAEFETKKMLYRQMLNEAAADVICCCEWEEYVDTESEGKAKDVIFGNYDSFIQAPGIGRYMRTAILSNGLKLTRIQRTQYTHSALSGGRYYQTATFRINGHDVKIVATHLDSNYSGNDPVTAAAYRLEQMETLIAAFENDQYVVLCADWNVAERSYEYNIFKEAGYDMANHGYLGDLDTYHFDGDDRGDLPIDNIIFKGFKPSRIEVYDKFNPELPLPNRNLSDHSPIAVTLTMIE